MLAIVGIVDIYGFCRLDDVAILNVMFEVCLFK